MTELQIDFYAKNVKSNQYLFLDIQYLFLTFNDFFLNILFKETHTFK